MTKPTKKVCTAQIGRLMVFENSFPKQATGIQELIDTLCQIAHTEDHAKRVIDRALSASEFCPMPVDLKRIAAATPIKETAPDGCGLCDYGWKRVDKEGQGGVRRCDCVRGRYFAELDRQRAAS